VLSEPSWSRRAYRKLDEIAATLEAPFSALNSDQEVLEDTDEWRKGVAALAALASFDALDEESQDIIASVKMELAQGSVRLARATWHKRQWRAVGLLCEQSLILTPGHREALRMREDSEWALLKACKYRR
jgi:hypothetical protein